MNQRKPLFLFLLAVALVTYVVYTRFFPADPGRSARTARNTIYQLAETTGVREAHASDISCSRENAIVRSVRKGGPAVVSISVTQLVKTRSYNPFYNDPFFDLFFPRYRKETYQRQNVPYIGSGFIISADGYVLTNYHVIEGAEEVQVTLSTKNKHNAAIVGVDPENDLALLKMKGSNFPFMTLGRSDDLMIGEWAIALGNPFGMVLDDPKPSVTVGVISAVHRDVELNRSMYRDMIQTDASINPGNSGGPLLNSNGECIGINTFIISKSGGSLGIGFAIPIDRVKEVVDEITTHGRVREAWTGLTVQNIDRLIAHSLGLKSTAGVIISRVAGGSPGAAAGLEVGDVVTHVNDKNVSDSAAIKKEFLGARVGDTFRLAIIRRGQVRRITLKLTEVPE